MSTSQLNSVGTEVSTGIYLTLWISLCFIDPSLLGFVAEIICFYHICTLVFVFCYVCVSLSLSLYIYTYIWTC